MAKINYRTAGWILAALAAMFISGETMWLYSRSIVSPWIIVAIALAIAAVSGSTLWRLWRKLTGSEKFTPNFLIHTVFFTIFISFLILFLNFHFADNKSEHEEKVAVERVYFKKRHRTRRVGRRYVANGEEYKVYYMDIAFSDGKIKQQSLTLSEYNSLRKGDTITYRLEKGLFGIPVITDTGDRIIKRYKKPARRHNPAL